MKNILAQAFHGTEDLIFAVRDVIDLLIPLTGAIALLYFFWGMAKFIRNAGSEDGREEGKQTMIWGIIALFVIVTIWGIVVFISDQLQIHPVSVFQWWSPNP